MSAAPVHRHRSTALAATFLAATTLVLGGCSNDSGDEKDGSRSNPETVRITLTENEVSPMGERVKVDAGEPVKVEITADRAGSLHVHSNPEQELEFVDGTVTRELTIDQPGVVEVESHDPDVVILQLEVR